MSTATIAHQDSTGNCAASSWSLTCRERRYLVLDAREALHQGDVAERVGRALGQIGMMRLHRALQRFGLAQHKRGQHGEQRRTG